MKRLVTRREKRKAIRRSARGLYSDRGMFVEVDCGSYQGVPFPMSAWVPNPSRLLRKRAKRKGPRLYFVNGGTYDARMDVKVRQTTWTLTARGRPMDTSSRHAT